jgi:cyclophilin family peptidyl-prolyl cis-trans isomerase/HEAT repeat protein
MRTSALPILLLLSLTACTSVPHDQRPSAAIADRVEYGMTVEEEARILAMEDRRAYEPLLVAWGIEHPNPIHRQRIALALGAIGSHTFIDTNGNGHFDPPEERRAGVEELTRLASDPHRRVRETAAFALGETGDPSAAEVLFALASDSDGAVASEAVEALSKFAQQPSFVAQHLARYVSLTVSGTGEGPRARAIRYLFRFDDDRASAAALSALGSSSPALRQEGAYSLSRRPHAPAREQLALVATDPNVLTRAYAVTALGRIGDPVSVPLLITALGDVHPWVRTNAAVAVGRVAEKERAVVRAEDVPRVLAASEDPDPGVRAAMIDTLGYYAAVNRTARGRLVDVFNNGSQWERELAAGTIARRLAPDSPELALLTNLTPWQTVRVLEATAATPHGAALRLQHAGAPEALVRAAVLNTIPDASAAAEIGLIRGGMADPDVVVRASAYGRHRHTASEPVAVRIQVLREAENRERQAAMNDARLAAIQALAEVDTEIGEFLISLVGDRDPVVRRVAANLVVSTGHASLPQYTPLPIHRTAAEYEEIVRWSRSPHTATIHMTRGDIQIALLAQDAPMTAWNFAELARKGYYDNTTFMRVVPNFVIQGGDPRNDMSGGPGYAIRDEINLQKYTRGAVGMALSGPDTGGSQFFITHSPQPHLDGGYTIFGRVWDGMSGVVDQTERGDRVKTITIDEHPPVGSAELESVPNVSLPLEVGMFPVEYILSRIPEYDRARSEYPRCHRHRDAQVLCAGRRPGGGVHGNLVRRQRTRGPDVRTRTRGPGVSVRRLVAGDVCRGRPLEAETGNSRKWQVAQQDRDIHLLSRRP